MCVCVCHVCVCVCVCLSCVYVLYCIRFDSDLSVAKDDVATERQEKEKLARGKHTLKSDFEELQEKLKATQEELEKANQEKEDLQSELLQQTSAASTESELTSIKRMKRELESKLETIEDELDEANLKSVNITCSHSCIYTVLTLCNA